MIHGGDYNPDQWIDQSPEVIEEDIRLMHLAGCNTFSVGIFAWERYEPREGEYHFDWMDAILDRLAKEGFNAILATPSGGKPSWMSRKYPEIRRVTRDGLREPHQARHNHCYTSPVYREKVAALNQRLAERYGDHPAVKMWHISNEYNGECYCDLCQAAFREWLREKYGTLENLHHAWWSAFWGHRAHDWEDISHPNRALEAQNLDWMRFVTDRTVNFMQHEIASVRDGGAAQPVTTNMMGLWPTIDFHRYTDIVDVIADDCYPQWRDRPDDWKTAAETAFAHDLHRSMKNGQPWMLMESCPSSPQWHKPPKLKRPGMARTEMLLATARGADAIMYFQWRKGRGAHEKFHGAVVDHAGHEHTRVFQEVADIGDTLQKLTPILGSHTRAETALIYDWDIRWALRFSSGIDSGSDHDDHYTRLVRAHHRPYWKSGIPTDVLESTADFTSYRLLIAPRLYLLKPGVAKAFTTFVRNGGTLLLTPYSGQVDESLRCFTGGWPGDGLRELTGIWVEETDRLLPDDVQQIACRDNSLPGLEGHWKTGDVCEIIDAEGAEVIAEYRHDFYRGTPALTRNRVGKGQVWYLAAEMEEDFLDAFHRALQSDLCLSSGIDTDLPEGVGASVRTDGETDFVFLQNFTPASHEISLDTHSYTCAETAEPVPDTLTLAPRQTRVLLRSADRSDQTIS